jgi:hypothetical protein
MEYQSGEAQRDCEDALGFLEKRFEGKFLWLEGHVNLTLPSRERKYGYENVQLGVE